MRLLLSITLVLLLGGALVPTHAETISWWRFEAGEDDDPSALGFENANEISGEPAMISDNATLGTSTPDLFDEFIPGTGDTNTGSVRSVTQAGSDGIFGEAAYSSTLDVSTITVEFWIRTTESQAGFVARTTDPDTGESGSITDGFRIVEPQNVRVDFWTADTVGNGDYKTSGNGSPSQTTINSGVAINDGDWHYIAFRYDETTGTASLVIDYQEFTTDLDDGDVLYWGGTSVTDRTGGGEPVVTIGNRLDGNANNQTGTIDEIRFTDQFEEDDELLNPIPEASTIVMGGLLIGFAIMSARKCLIELLFAMLSY